MKRLGGNRHKAALVRAVRGSKRPLSVGRVTDADLGAHLEATYRWLCAAHDATMGGGVSGLFDLWSGSWAGSYPETTGYIIPTFLALAEARRDDEAYSRALRLADWSCHVQMDDGAVLSGLVGMRKGPAVFNTGQAIFGWVSAYESSGDERYAEVATKAGDWLLRQQDRDGAWRRNLSIMTDAPVHTYNGRCAWALAYAAKVLGQERFAAGARQASEWVLLQQNDAGWFAHNGFSEHDVPLLHTIAYVIEGLLGVYAYTGERRYLDASRRALEPIIALARAGPLAGRLDERWQGAVSWRCVTGEAQIATLLHRLERHCPGIGYGETARGLIGEIARIQLTLTDGRSLRDSVGPAVGGVPGSFPIWGQYVRFGLPNWAAKFYLDALLLEVLGVDEKSYPRLPSS